MNAFCPAGWARSASPVCREPDSIRPEMESGFCTPPRKMSPIVIRSGFVKARVMGSELSSSSTIVGPPYQAMSSGSMDLRTMLSPCKPQQGMKVMFLERKPAAVRKADICCEISVKRSSDQETVSSLLTAMMILCTPMLRTSKACSFVWPLSPDSKEPVLASMTRTAKSACEAPAIMLGMKSRWPGASRMVKLVFAVENLFVAMSMVTPRALSSEPWSSTHARAKEDLPIFSASERYLAIVLSSMTLRS